MNNDCLFNILMYSSPKTITNSISLNKQINKLNNNHLWRSLHARDYTPSKIARNNMLKKLIKKHKRTPFPNLPADEFTKILKKLPKLQDNEIVDVLLKIPGFPQHITNDSLWCTYCSQDKLSYDKILNKEYYQLYKSHNIFNVDITIIQQDFIIIDHNSYYKFNCQVDNCSGSHVSVTIKYTTQLPNNLYIGQYLPLNLFHGKKTGDQIPIYIRKHLFMLNLIDLDVDKLLYNLSCSFKNVFVYDYPLPAISQYDMFIQAHKDFADSHNFPIKHPLTFINSEVYRNELEEYKCNGILIFYNYHVLYYHFRSKITLTEAIDHFTKRTCLRETHLKLIDEISFPIKETKYNKYFIHLPKDKSKTTSKKKHNIITLKYQIFKLVATQELHPSYGSHCCANMNNLKGYDKKTKELFKLSYEKYNKKEGHNKQFECKFDLFSII